jgi:rhodanese-related sulfurtransferase
MRHTLHAVLVSGLMLSAAFFPGCEQAGPPVPRISAAEALQLAGQGNAVLVDVRTARTWETSAIKIKGAERRDPEAVDQWAATYTPRQTLIFYCA